MRKTILVTGATDGIGLLTARLLHQRGHAVLLHGRSRAKLDAAAAALAEDKAGDVKTFLCDLSDLDAVAGFAKAVRADHATLDVLINNAGVLKTAEPRMADGRDIRFVVNTIAPYRLAKALLPMIPRDGRIINLSSAAQAEIDFEAMRGARALADMPAYAQSKRAITLWSMALAAALPEGPAILAANPGSLLASKMVHEGFGVAGHDLRIGADLLVAMATDAAYAEASGRRFDNDAGHFAPVDGAQTAALMALLDGAGA